MKIDRVYVKSVCRIVICRQIVRESGMGLFKRKSIARSYDRENTRPVIKASVCNGEQVAGFKDIHTGKFKEVMLIKDATDLDKFRSMYGIDEEIRKEY